MVEESEGDTVRVGVAVTTESKVTEGVKDGLRVATSVELCN